MPSARLVAFIAGWESFRADAFPDPYNPKLWTIGFGRTRGVSSSTPRCTREQAMLWLTEDVGEAAAAVSLWSEKLKKPLAQNEYDALVSLVYNAGAGALRGTEIDERITAGARTSAGNAFTAWHYARGVPSVGLFKRRVAERAMFLYADYNGRP